MFVHLGGASCWLGILSHLLVVMLVAAGSDGSSADPLVVSRFLMPYLAFGHPQIVCLLGHMGKSLLDWLLVVHGKHEGVLGQQARLVGLKTKPSCKLVISWLTHGHDLRQVLSRGQVLSWAGHIGQQSHHNGRHVQPSGREAYLSCVRVRTC